MHRLEASKYAIVVWTFAGCASPAAFSADPPDAGSGASDAGPTVGSNTAVPLDLDAGSGESDSIAPADAASGLDAQWLQPLPVAPFADAGCAQVSSPGGALTECYAGTSTAVAKVCAPQFKPAGQSRCPLSPASATCTPVISTVGGRQVYWQVPLGSAPPGGWPAVIVFQGSLFGPNLSWSGGPGLPFGGFNQVKLQALLLDNGFAVIAPTTSNGAYWLTNFPGYETSPDNTFMLALLADIHAGMTFGPLDRKRLFATGISSGGFMTSRMAVTYPGHFAALAIESAGYATCPGCGQPLPALPPDHPPTLFLHGGADTIVASSFDQDYFKQLTSMGIEGELILDPKVGHQWLDVAPEAVTCWFLEH